MLAVLLTIVGYVVAIFAAANIVLPLLWAWPKAIRLRREGRLRSPIPAFRFVVPALVSTVILWGSYVLVGWLVRDPSGYAFGVTIGGLQNLRLVFKPNADMEADFNDAYGEYMQMQTQEN